MIFQALSWIRLLIALLAMYVFLYEYMFKKYFYQMHIFDEFYWKNHESKFKEIQSFFNSQQNKIQGQHFSYLSNGRPLCEVGQLKDLKAKDSLTEPQAPYEKILQEEPSLKANLLDSLFTQRVDNYIIDFYNWYRFEFTFTDLGHDSYLTFRLIEIKKGSHKIVEKIPLTLPDHFFQLDLNDTSNKLNINYQSNGISLNITQTFYPAQYNDPESDGLQIQKLLYLTENKSSITPEEYRKFGSAKTLTQFNFTFERKDYEINANLTHVIRHNQCLTTHQNGKIRHKCMGGYGKGKISFSQFLRQQHHIKEKRYIGNWERNSYNLDNSRARTTFVGERVFKNPIDSVSESTELLKKLDISSLETILKPQYQVDNSVEFDFLGFHKLEYYAKHDKIEKQRWVGMTIYQSLNQNGLPISSNPHENHFFINGNIHRIHNMEISVPLIYKNIHQGQVIRFMNYQVENKQGKMTPTYDIEFQVSHINVFDENRLWGSKKVYRVDGFCRGWIDEGVLFKDEKLRQHYNDTAEYGYVQFYEIMGTLKFTQHLK